MRITILYLTHRCSLDKQVLLLYIEYSKQYNYSCYNIENIDIINSSNNYTKDPNLNNHS